MFSRAEIAEYMPSWKKKNPLPLSPPDSQFAYHITVCVYTTNIYDSAKTLGLILTLWPGNQEWGVGLLTMRGVSITYPYSIFLMH